MPLDGVKIGLKACRRLAGLAQSHIKSRGSKLSMRVGTYKASIVSLDICASCGAFTSAIFVVGCSAGSSGGSAAGIALFMAKSVGHSSESRLLGKEEIDVVHSENLCDSSGSVGRSRLLASEHSKYIEWSLGKKK